MTWSRDRVIRDPLLRSIPAIEPAPQISMPRLATFKVAQWASGLRIAQDGSHVALRHGNPDSDEKTLPPYVVYGPEGSRTPVECLDLAFLNGQGMLLLKTAGADLELAASRFDGSAPAWRLPLIDVRSGRLALSPDAARWRVTSQSRDGTLVRMEGRVGRGEVARTEWKLSDSDEPWSVHGSVGNGPASLRVRQKWSVPGIGWAASMLSAWAGGYTPESTISIGDRNSSTILGRSESHVTCVEPAWDENRFVCVASRGNLTNVFTVDASAPTMVPVGSIEGHFYPTAVSSGGVVVGSWNGTPALLRLPERRIERLAEHLGEAAINGGAMGFVHAQLGDTEAVLFRRKP